MKAAVARALVAEDPRVAESVAVTVNAAPPLTPDQAGRLRAAALVAPARAVHEGVEDAA